MATSDALTRLAASLATVSRSALAAIAQNGFHLASVAAAVYIMSMEPVYDLIRASVDRASANFTLPAIFSAGLFYASALLVVKARPNPTTSQLALYRVEPVIVAITPVVLTALFCYRAGLEMTGLLLVFASVVLASAWLLIGHRSSGSWSRRTAVIALVVLLAVSAATAGMLVVDEIAKIIGPFGIIVLALAAWAVCLTAFVVALPLIAGIPTVSIVFIFFAVAWAIPSEDIHRFPRRSGNRATADESIRAAPDVETRLRAWLAERVPRDYTGPVPIVLVSAEGGGIRAGYWAARSLATLNAETDGRLARYIFAYSGVSGGSLGLTTFIDGSAKHSPSGLLEVIDRYFTEDFTSPIAARLLVTEPLRYLLGCCFKPRDRVFEEHLSAHWSELAKSDTFDRPFSEAFGVNPPIVLYNATSAENGKLAMLSNASFNDLQQGFEYFSDVIFANPWHAPRVSVVEGVHLSARFPGVSPPASIYLDRDNEVLHAVLVDGGYYDNTGTAGLAHIYTELVRIRSAARAKIRSGPSDDVLVKQLSQLSFHVISTRNVSSDDLLRRARPLSDIGALLGTMMSVRRQRGIVYQVSLANQIRRENDAIEQSTACPQPNQMPSWIEAMPPEERSLWIAPEEGPAEHCGRILDTFTLSILEPPNVLRSLKIPKEQCNTDDILEPTLSWTLSRSSGKTVVCNTFLLDRSTVKLDKIWQSMSPSR